MTYECPSKKCKDFMKNFPKNFDPIFCVAVVKLRSARRPQGGVWFGLASFGIMLPMFQNVHFCSVHSKLPKISKKKKGKITDFQLKIKI